MLSYRYTARNTATGQKVKSVVQAQNEKEAAKLIRQEGLAPLDIQLSEHGAVGVFGRLQRVRSKDRVLFSRQLSTLINAGLPIVQSLRTVSEQTENKALRVVINQIIADVEAGSTLAASMQKYPKVFNRVYISLIAAGEASGTLDRALDRLAIQQEKDAEIISKVRGAMIYPILVVCVMVAVLTFMLVKVLPQVEILYAGLPGAHLPLVTRILLSVSHFAIHFWWVVLLVLIILIVAGSRYARTLGGRGIIDSVKMHAWPIKTLFMKMYMARFARTGATLVGSGVPLLQVLDITSEAVDNVHIADSIHRASEKVKGGKALSESIRNDKNFLPLVPNMLSVGEQSGALEAMLEKIADYYEKEVDNEIKAISTVIEPVLMIVLGIVAFTIVAAVLLPIYGLANQSFVQF